MQKSTSLLERRLIEAEMLAAVYEALCGSHGQETALDVIRRTVETVAYEAGRAFAAAAPDGPGFEHFRTVVELWKGTGALRIENEVVTPNTLRFDVTRCEYVAAYREMGLPPELRGVLSCARDAPFARGYSDRIEFSRPDTIADGKPACGFSFHWRE